MVKACLVRCLDVPDKCILFLLTNIMNAKAKKDQLIYIIGVILEFD